MKLITKLARLIYTYQEFYGCSYLQAIIRMRIDLTLLVQAEAQNSHSCRLTREAPPTPRGEG